MAKQTVAGKQVTVLGAARSGAAVARLLQRNGASVFVSDSGSGEVAWEKLRYRHTTAVRALLADGRYAPSTANRHRPPCAVF